jgi:hypothetical protein
MIGVDRRKVSEAKQYVLDSKNSDLMDSIIEASSKFGLTEKETRVLLEFFSK